MVPPPVKAKPAPDVVKLMLPPVERPVVAWTPLETSKPPLNELEPVFDEKKVPAVTKLAAVTFLVTVNDLEILSDPAKEEEPVPLSTMLPPIDALFTNSKLLETDALEAVNNETPVMFCELPVIAPAKV